jgi:carboxyl-terminal processing protease
MQEEAAKSLSLFQNIRIHCSSLPYYEIVETSKDSVLKEKRDRWHEGLSKDVYVEEALNVLDDLQSKVGFKKRHAR